MKKSKDSGLGFEVGDPPKHQHLPNFSSIPNHPEGAWHGNLANSSTSDLPLMSLVTGSNRCKYFNRPLINLEGFQIQPSDDEFWWFGLQEPEPLEYKNIATQTDYRENDTQTDPWDPPFKTPPPSPFLEITTLTELEYGKGLPVGPDEIENLLLAREKRAWESQVPPVSCDRQEMIHRHNLIAKQKIKEINHVKDKIEEHFQTKYEQLQLSMAAKTQQREERKNHMLMNLFKIKKQDLKKKTCRLKDNLIKRLQYIERKRSVLTNKPNFDDIKSLSTLSLDFVPSSDVSSAEQFYLESCKGLVDLERWLWEEQKIVMEPEIYGPKKEPKLTRIEKIIEQPERPAKVCLIPLDDEKAAALRWEKTKIRPITPTAKGDDQEYLDRETHITAVQQLIRGRALQKEVLEMCLQYENLIDELLKIRPVNENDILLTQDNRNYGASCFLELKIEADKKKSRAEILERYEGNVISQELNLWGKSIQRYEVSDELGTFIRRAKEERRRREAEEAGRRQHEILQQRILDQLFNEIHGRLGDIS